MRFDLRLASAAQLGRFMLRERLHHWLDRHVHRQSREAALLDFLLATVPQGGPAAVIQAMDRFALSRRWLMNVGPIKGDALIEALRSVRAQRVLEVGSYCGYSAILIGQFLATNGGSLISLEKSKRVAGIAGKIIAHAGLDAVVDLRVGILSDHLRSFDQPFEAIFLDHWKDEYLPDLRRIEQANLLQPGGIVIADNVGLFAVYDYLDYVRTSGRYESRYVSATVEYEPSLPDGIEISRHKVHR